jgi:hypothetical protein
MINNFITYKRMFPLSYVIGLNVNSTLFTHIFKRGHHKNHQVFRVSLLLQTNSANIYPVTSVCNSFNLCRSLTIISTTVGKLTYLNCAYCIEQSPSLEVSWFSASQEIPRKLWNPKDNYHIYNSRQPVIILNTVA